MQTWAELDEVLASFGARATARRARPLVREQAWLLALTPRELVRLGRAARRRWWQGGALGPSETWRRTRLAPDVVRAALAAIHPDGRVRERGVAALALHEDPLAARFLALNVVDHQVEVRTAAWAGLSRRTRPLDACDVVPVLVALGDRLRGVSELDRYLDLCLRDPDGARLIDLETVADRDTRLLVYRRLGFGDVAPGQLERWARRETDQAARRLLTRALAERAPDRCGWLLTSPRADDRLVAMWWLPDESVSAGQVADAMTGRAAGLREAARWRHRKAGGDPADFYARRLAEVSEDDRCLPGLLAGLREVGVPLQPDVATRFISHPAPAVRAEALRGWAAPGPAAELLLAMVGDTSPRVARAAARRLPARTVAYDDLAELATSASLETRRSALVARRARGDWSRVRADLEAMADTDLRAEAQADLVTWLRNRAVRVYSVPEGADRIEILRMLPEAGLAPLVERELRFCIR